MSQTQNDLKIVFNLYVWQKGGKREEGERSKWKEGMGNKDEREVAEGLVAVSSGVGDQAQAEPSENATGMPPTLLILGLMAKKPAQATHGLLTHLSSVKVTQNIAKTGISRCS